MRAYRWGGVMALILVGLATWQLIKPQPTYSPQEIAEAGRVVEEYYGALDQGEYAKALALVATPAELERDWAYEGRFMADQLRTLAATGQYRLIFSGHAGAPMGRPGHLPTSEPLRFLVVFQTVVNGQVMYLNEVPFVAREHGQFRLVGFDSVDHFVRFRALTFRLPRVLNAPLP